MYTIHGVTLVIGDLTCCADVARRLFNVVFDDSPIVIGSLDIPWSLEAFVHPPLQAMILWAHVDPSDDYQRAKLIQDIALRKPLTFPANLLTPKLYNEMRASQAADKAGDGK